MRYFALTLLILATGLWLGGLVALFLFAPAVFDAFRDDRATAGVATSAMFAIFSRFQLAVAPAALLGAFLGYACTRRKWFMGIFAILALAAMGAVANHVWLVPQMEALRLAGESSGKEFARMHGYSMMLYVSVTTLLTLATVLLPGAKHTAEAPRQPGTAETDGA